MAGYAIIDTEITDKETFSKFIERIPAVVESYGGKFVVRGGTVEVVQGDWNPSRLVIIEFESAEQALNWENSQEFAELRELRNGASNSNVIVIEGV